MVKETILILLFSLPLIVKGCRPHWVGDGYTATAPAITATIDLTMATVVSIAV